MISDTVYRNCPNCGIEVLCDEHDCGCIFGKCNECNTDFEFDEHCQNDLSKLWKLPKGV